MKKLLAVIVGVSVALSAVGCSAKTKSEKETKADEKTVITYWNGFTGTDGEVMQRIVDNYNESNQLNVEISCIYGCLNVLIHILQILFSFRYKCHNNFYFHQKDNFFFGFQRLLYWIQLI